MGPSYKLDMEKQSERERARERSPAFRPSLSVLRGTCCCCYGEEEEEERERIVDRISVRSSTSCIESTACA